MRRNLLCFWVCSLALWIGRSHSLQRIALSSWQKRNACLFCKIVLKKKLRKLKPRTFSFLKIYSIIVISKARAGLPDRCHKVGILWRLGVEERNESVCEQACLHGELDDHNLHKEQLHQQSRRLWLLLCRTRHTKSSSWINFLISFNSAASYTLSLHDALPIWEQGYLTDVTKWGFFEGWE